MFVLAFLSLNARQEKTIQVVAAAVDLPAGHTLLDTDLTLVEAAKNTLPQGAVSDPSSLVGQTLRVDRTAGDYITTAHVGGQNVELAPDERAIAVEVNDSAGLGGLLKPGDMVGITAILAASGQTGYAKMIAEGLRVLYVSPEFRSIDPAEYQQDEDSGGFGASDTPTRETSGVVVLAVPIDDVVVAYDFAPFGVESEARIINVVDLLPALDQLSNVKLSLFIQPQNAKKFTTSGVSLPELVVTPGPSPTPGPEELQSAESPAGAATPAPTPIPTISTP